MNEEWTPERFKRELLDGRGRWLFTIFAMLSLVLLVWAPLDKDMEVFFPIHLRQKGVIVAAAINFTVWTLLAGLNWRQHGKE